MEQNNTELLAKEESAFKLRDFIPLKFIYTIIFIFISTIIIYSSQYFYQSKIEQYKQNKYLNSTNDYLVYLKTLIEMKINSSYLLASSLANHSDIKISLLNNNTEILDLDKILIEAKTKREYSNIKVEVFNSKGEIFKSNFFKDIQNSSTKIDLVKQSITTYESNMFGYFIKHVIPIVNDGTIVGYFCLYNDLDQIAELTKNYNINTLILLNSVDSKKVYQNRSHSKTFIENIYIVNSNANKYIERLIKQFGVDDFMNDWDMSYKIDNDKENLIIRNDIKVDNKLDASIFMFKPISQIDLSEISTIKSWYIVISILIVLSVGFFIFFIYSLVRIKELSLENSSLIIVNEDLKIKTDELDFNEKKLENLFNVQPNLMMMHNGREITKGNKRFMGFFKRFGSFEGFRKEHKCVSELFEKFDEPNYIWDEYIDDIFWVDYILQNPKRLYKVVISRVDGEQHHFVVKLNELNYAKHVSERLIVIALVDVTQDLENYKFMKDK